MKKRISGIVTLLFLLIICSGTVYPQQDCEIPLSPVLTLVSYNYETEETELSWDPSPSQDIAGYVLYEFNDGDGIPFDTLWDPAATSYTFPARGPDNYSISYVIAAYREPDCVSPLSNALRTLFIRVMADTCNNKLEISWNPYIPNPLKVNNYTVLISVNDNPFSEAGNSVDDNTEFTLNNFITDTEYCFVVRANLEGNIYSTSNKNCLVTRMQRSPLWINADYASVDTDDNISLSFTIDSLSEITDFILERRVGMAGSFTAIAFPESLNSKVLYTDDQADTDSINYYRLAAVNNCGNPVVYSNLASNIVLYSERTDDLLTLQWNPCSEWLGSVDSYELFINTGNGYGIARIFTPDDTSFMLNYREIMYEITGDEFCLYICANETANPYGLNASSYSSRVCAAPDEVITVPNVFSPNSGTTNAFFRPVLSFTPPDYHLIVSDRRGNILFQTDDFTASWDGTSGGKTNKQGVYLWILRITTPSGKTLSRTGTITILSSN